MIERTVDSQPEADSAGQSSGALGRFGGNLLRTPRAFRDSLVRHGRPTSDRAASQAVFTNFFLHIMPVRIHRYSLRLKATLGLGVISFVLFVLLTVTGTALMIYYKPSTADAYNSMKDIHYVVPTGRFMRNIHRWAAHAMVACVELETDRCLSYKAKARYNERAANWEVKLTPSLGLDAPTAGSDPAAERRGVCGECYMFCPVRGKAIEREQGEFFAPLIYPDHCIGCGLCEEICRQIVRGEPAIRVVSTRGEV